MIDPTKYTDDFVEIASGPFGPQTLLWVRKDLADEVVDLTYKDKQWYDKNYKDDTAMVNDHLDGGGSSI